MKLDLHIHTTYSDGALNPKEVVDIAVSKGMSGIAITDHDSISAIKPALEYINNMSKKSIILVPGIEFGCIHQNEEIHILGYFIDYNNPELTSLLNKLKESRLERCEKIIHKLRELRIDISLGEVYEKTNNGLIGRPHIARVLVEKGYANSINNAFDKYIDINRPAYVPRYKLDVKYVIDLINRIDGISILAHPGLLKNKSNVYKCIDLGIDGIECIHSDHNDKDTMEYIDICKDKDLIITGGSDCHGKIIDGDLLLGKYFLNSDNFIPRRYYE